MEDEDYILPVEEVKKERIRKERKKDGRKKKEKLEISSIAKMNESRTIANSLERIAILDTVFGNSEIEGFCREFEQEFFRHPHFESLVWKGKEGKEKYYQEHKRVLCTLYKIVNKFGGYKEVVSRHEWKPIADKIGYKTAEEAKIDYLKFFFFYERLTNPDSLFTMSYSKDKVKLEDANPYCLLEVPHIHASSLKSIEKEVADNILSNTAYIIKNFAQAVDLNPNVFKIESVLPIMKNDEIDVCIQKMTTGVITECKLSKGTLTFKEFLADLSSSLKLEVNENSQIKCGINFDVSPFLRLVEELTNKIPNEFRFCSSNDILRNSRQHVKGTTLPQMFIHPPQTWIGGHQQPVGLRCAILNHGPGDLEWTIIAPNSIPIVEKIFSDTYGIEMFRNEGLWYVSTDLLIANNIECYTVTQREGDLLLLGPGVVSMRKATGLCYQTSWNFATKDLCQLSEGFNRTEMDAKCCLTEPVPFYTLVLDTVNQEIDTFGIPELRLIYEEFKAKMVEDSSVLDEFLNLFYIKEKDIHIEDMRALFTHEPNNCNILFCTRCAQEIFNYWVIVPLSVEEGPHYFCISCANKRVDFLRNNQNESKFFYKYSEKHLNSLLGRILRKIRDPKSRYESKIAELSSSFKLEVIEPSEKEKEKEAAFRKSKFIRELLLRELKSKEVKFEDIKGEESKIDNGSNPKNLCSEALEKPTEDNTKGETWETVQTEEKIKFSENEFGDFKPSSEETKKDVNGTIANKAKDLRASLMSIVQENLAVESCDGSPMKKQLTNQLMNQRLIKRKHSVLKKRISIKNLRLCLNCC